MLYVLVIISLVILTGVLSTGGRDSVRTTKVTVKPPSPKLPPSLKLKEVEVDQDLAKKIEVLERKVAELEGQVPIQTVIAEASVILKDTRRLCNLMIKTMDNYAAEIEKKEQDLDLLEMRAKYF